MSLGFVLIFEGEGTDVVLYGIDSPMPRATEHVDALMLQFEGLQSSIAELEEELKQVKVDLSIFPPMHTFNLLAVASPFEDQSTCTARSGITSSDRVIGCYTEGRDGNLRFGTDVG